MSLSDASPLMMVGAGKMGGAMLHGWLKNGLSPSGVTVIDPVLSDEMQALVCSQKIAHHTEPGPGECARILILAVKPQILTDLLPNLLPLINDRTTVVSIAAGITLETIAKGLGTENVVRTMPNTPAQVARGATVGVAAKGVTAQSKAVVEELLSAVGTVGWVTDEALIDCVTGLSGSGPAYVFHLVEAMAAAGEKAGLEPNLAMMLARQTVAGAGELLFQSRETAETLRKNVTSQNGTTAAGLQALMDDEGLSPLMKRTIDAAIERSRELGKS